MSLTITNEAITSGSTFTIPDDVNNPLYIGLGKYEKHRVSISGAGTATITADMGSGYQAIDTMSANYNTYLIPGAIGIKVVASGGDIVLSMKSYSDGDTGC